MLDYKNGSTGGLKAFKLHDCIFLSDHADSFLSIYYATIEDITFEFLTIHCDIGGGEIK